MRHLVALAVLVTLPALAAHAGPPEGAGSILKGKDDKESIAIMKSYNKALGVKCNFCHVKKGKKKWDYEAWTKHKRIALHMHREYVEKLKGADGSAVTCNTCHQGRKSWLKKVARGR